MADPEVKQTETEEKDPKKNPNILDADSDGKISSDELQKQLETADARNFTWKTGEGLKSYLEDKPQDKEAFKNMCEKILTDKSMDISPLKEKMKATPTRAEVAKDKTLFTSQERGTIALTSLYLWLKGTPKAENYEVVRNFLLDGVAKDAQWADVKLDTITPPEEWKGEEIVLGASETKEKTTTQEETKEQDKEESKTPQDTSTTQEWTTTQGEITDPNESTDTWVKDTQENKELSPKEQEALERSSQELVDQHTTLNQSVERIQKAGEMGALLYAKSPLFGEIMTKRDTDHTQKAAATHEDIKNDYPQDWNEIAQNLPSVYNQGELGVEGNQGIDVSKITWEDWKLNHTGEVIRLQMRASLQVMSESFTNLAKELTANADNIATPRSAERTALDEYIQTIQLGANNAHTLLTNLWSESGKPAEGAFLQQIEQINKNNFLDQLFSGKLPAGSTTITDIYTPQKQFDALRSSNESMRSTFGLSNTLKNGKLDEIRTSLSQFKNNAVAHEINGEIFYFNKEQLGKQWLLWDTGEIKDESDQLLLDAKASGKVGAWSVSELVKDAHQNKNVVFHPNEDGKDMRQLDDQQQQARLENLATNTDTTLPEAREAKVFDEQDLAGKLDKKASLSESRLILTDILKQPWLKRTALSMEKPEQALLNQNDFLKLNIGDETRYISTNDYLDLTQDSRETNKREKNNIDDNKANETEKTRINYLDLAEQKYNLTAYEEDGWKVETQGSTLMFANKETDQIIGLDMKNTDAPTFSFSLDNKPFSLTTSPEHAEKVFTRIQDLNEKYTSLQEAYQDKDTKSTDHVFQLGFLQDHASDLISGKEMNVDATARTGIKDLPTGKQKLTIDNLVYDDKASLLSYSATGEKKNEKIIENTNTENTNLDYLKLAKEKYNLTRDGNDWEMKNEGNVLTFENKESKQQISIDMKNTDAPTLQFWLDDNNFSVPTTPWEIEKVFGRVEDLQDKFQTLQRVLSVRDSNDGSPDPILQLSFLLSRATDLVTGKQMSIDTRRPVGGSIPGLPNWEQSLTIDNLVYDGNTRQLIYKKKETENPPPTNNNEPSTYR
jgi:hypothetical protein